MVGGASAPDALSEQMRAPEPSRIRERVVLGYRITDQGRLVHRGS